VQIGIVWWQRLTAGCGAVGGMDGYLFPRVQYKPCFSLTVNFSEIIVYTPIIDTNKQPVTRKVMSQNLFKITGF
jgi:hypothetical protein